MRPTKRPRPNDLEDIWVENKPIIRRLYQEERKTLKEVKQVLELEYGFPKTPLSTYETKLRELLGLRKKLKKTDWPVVYQHWLKRGGKETAVYLNGTKLPSAWKEIRRSGARPTNLANSQNSIAPDRDCPLPAGIVVRTPSPSPTPGCLSFLPAPGLRYCAAPNPTISCTVTEPYISAVKEHPYGNTCFGETTSFCPPVSINERTLPCSVLENPRMTNTHVDSTPLSTPVCSAWQPALAASYTSQTQPVAVPSPKSLYRFCLETAPWLRLLERLERLYLPGNKVVQPLVGGHINPIFDQFQALSGPELPENIYFPSLTYRELCSQLPLTVTATSSFGTYKFLAATLYSLSNRVWQTLGPSEQVEFFELLLDQMSQPILLQLLASNEPSIQAAWEALITLSVELLHKEGFTFLMSFRDLHPEWIRQGRHTYLYCAARMGCYDIVKYLLAVGARPDTALRLQFKYGLPAVLSAVEGGCIHCTRLLIASCDLNREACDSEYKNDQISIFQALIVGFADSSYKSVLAIFSIEGLRHSSLSLDNPLHRQMLDMFLKKGVNVDLPWKDRSNGPISSLSGFYNQNKIPVDWRPTILECVYHWSKPLFNILVSYSALPSSELSRTGIYLAAKRGTDALVKYLRSAQGYKRKKKFLELVLAELLLMQDVIDGDIIRALVASGVDATLPSINRDSSLLLSALLRGARLPGLNDEAFDILKLLIREGAVIDSRFLSEAVENDGIVLLEKLSRYSSNIVIEGALALSQAACLNNFEAVSWLIQSGVDINAEVPTDEGMRTILAIVANDGNNHIGDFSMRHGRPTPEMIRYLVALGARPRLNEHSTSPFEFLRHALMAFPDRDNLGKIEAFLDYGIDLGDEAGTESQLLEACLRRWSVDSDRLKVFEMLYRRGARIIPGSPLSLLIYYGGRKELVQELLDAGADLNAYSGQGAPGALQYTPIQAAASKGNLSLVTQLLQRGADVNRPALGNRGRTALQAACEWNPLSGEERLHQTALVRLLIEHGADVNALPADDINGLTALQIIAAQGNMDTAYALLVQGADPNTPSSYDSFGAIYTALDFAAKNGRIDMVKFLLSAGALSKCRGSTGYAGAVWLAEKYAFHAVADLIQMHTAEDILVFGGNLALQDQDLGHEHMCSDTCFQRFCSDNSSVEESDWASESSIGEVETSSSSGSDEEVSSGEGYVDEEDLRFSDFVIDDGEEEEKKG